MSKFIRHGRTVRTFFDLLGSLENDMTDALALSLSRSGSFLRVFLADPGYSVPFRDEDDVVLSVQTRRPEEGITDLEIQVGDSFFGIVEAKRGSVLPTESQLKLYAPVLIRRSAQVKILVALTTATPTFAAEGLGKITLPGVTLVHRSWREVRCLAIQARAHDTHDAKRLLDQFVGHIEMILGMDTRYDNQVCSVSWAGNPESWSLSWIDIVEKRARYFYPVGHRWPDPPNYLGFRYRGKLQRIHHVDGHEIIRNFRAVFPEAPDERIWCPHYCFTLGPAIVPPHDVAAGPRVQRNNRVWCMIDTLLTCSTVSDALTETEKRRSRP